MLKGRHVAKGVCARAEGFFGMCEGCINDAEVMRWDHSASDTQTC